MSVAKIWHQGQWISISLGEKGDPGSDGRDITLQVSGTTLQYQHVGDSTWLNLFDFSTLNGGAGIAPLPSITSVSPTTANSTGTQTITITGTHLTGATQVQLRETDGTTNIQTLSSVTVVSDTTVTAVLNIDSVTTPDRGSAKRLYVTTAAGSAYGTLTVASPSAPAVSGVTPSTTATTGSATVTINGTNLTGVTQIALMDATGTNVVQYLTTPTVVSATQVTGVLNIDSVTDAYRGIPLRIYVTSSNGTAYGTLTVGALAPTVTSISPTTLPGVSQSTVLVNGTHLDNASAVKLYATDGTTLLATLSNVVVQSDTQVSATFDPTNIGPGSRDTTTRLYVTTPGGSAFGNTTVNGRPPTVTGVSPATTAASGTQTVTVTGTGLTGVSSVQLVASDGVTVIATLTSVNVASDTQVTASLAVSSVGSAYQGTPQRLYVTNTHGTSYGTITVPVAGAVPTVTSATAFGGGQGSSSTQRTISYHVSGSHLSAATSINLYSSDGSTLLATGTGFAFGGSNTDSYVEVDFNNLSGVSSPTSTMRIVATNSNGSTYVTVPSLAPTITSVAPSQLDTNAGSSAQVALYGSGFTGWGSDGTAPTVKMIATDGSTVIATLSSVTVVADNTAYATLTFSGVGSGYENTAERIYVGNSLGSSYVPFKVTSGGAVPTVTHVSPGSSLDDATFPVTVTLTGTGFTGATAVVWEYTPSGAAYNYQTGQAGSSMTNFTVVSGTSITFQFTGVPSVGVGVEDDGHLVVLGATGNSATSSADVFSFIHDSS